MTPLEAPASAERPDATRPRRSRPPLERRHSAHPGPPRGAHPAQRRSPTLAPARVARAGTLGPFLNTHTRARPRAHTQACSTPTSRLNGPPPLRHTLVGGRVWEADTPTSPSRASSLAPLTPSYLLSTGALNLSFPRHPTPGTHPTSTLNDTHSCLASSQVQRALSPEAPMSREGLGKQGLRCWGSPLPTPTLRIPLLQLGER